MATVYYLLFTNRCRFVIVAVIFLSRICIAQLRICRARYWYKNCVCPSVCPSSSCWARVLTAADSYKDLYSIGSL